MTHDSEGNQDLTSSAEGMAKLPRQQHSGEATADRPALRLDVVQPDDLSQRVLSLPRPPSALGLSGSRSLPPPRSFVPPVMSNGPSTEEVSARVVRPIRFAVTVPVLWPVARRRPTRRCDPTR